MGGKPLFDQARPIGQLDMPPVEKFLKFVRKIYDSRRFTNNGPLVQELESRLAETHGTRYCVTMASATLAESMLLRCLASGKKGNVIMPAFTYSGLTHIARWAGQTPSFCDVDPDRHSLSIESIESVINESTTAIFAVGNTHDPGNIDALEAVAAKHNVPLFFDSVYTLGSTYKGKKIGGFGEAEVFSMHATKLLNGFEGGYVTTNNEQLAHELRTQGNFGFRPPTEKSKYNFALGINAKLNELHAAMALCCLEQLPQVMAENRERYEAYCHHFRNIPGISFLQYRNPNEETYNYLWTVAETGAVWPLNRDNTVKMMRAENMRINPYYSPLLHLSRYCPPGLKVPPLPVSESLAKKYFQMPVGALVSIADIKKIAELFKFITDNGNTVKKHFKNGNSH
jgi:dTDP-4-amino-4,6-dideoxygalactose transaminase